MSAMNIAILAGVIPLLGLLVKLRRDRQARDEDDLDAPAPRAAAPAAATEGPLAAGASWVVGSGTGLADAADGDGPSPWTAGDGWPAADAPAAFAGPPAAVAGDDEEPTADVAEPAWLAGLAAPEGPDGDDPAPAWGDAAGDVSAPPPADPPPEAPAASDEGLSPAWAAWASDAPASDGDADVDAGGPPAPPPDEAAEPTIAWDQWAGWAPGPDESPAPELAAAEVAATVAPPPLAGDGLGAATDAPGADGGDPFAAFVAEAPADPRVDDPFAGFISGAPADPPAGDDPFARFISAAPADAPPAAPAPGDGEPVAWWDLDEPAPAPDDAHRRGHFALGGHALFPGQPVIAGVSYRAPLAAPPEGGAAAIDLRVEAATNCDRAGVRVVDDPGFGPTAEGFTVRAEADAVGEFMVAGTFEVREG